MDETIKELIAIGASVSAHCNPCVSFHVSKAQELGISEAQILEAIAIGQMVERGAGLAMREFTQELMGNATPTHTCCVSKG